MADYNARLGLLGKLPEPKWDGNKLTNLEEIKQWLKFNCLEVNRCFVHKHHMGIQEETVLWLCILTLCHTKEAMIETAMNRPPSIVITTK